MILTYKYRLKNRNAKSALRRHAYAVNQESAACSIMRAYTQAQKDRRAKKG